KGAIVVALVLCVCATSLVSPRDVVANQASITEEAGFEEKVGEEVNSASEEAKIKIENILTGDEFNQKEIDEVWHFPFEFDWDRGDTDLDFLAGLGKFIEALIRGLATWGELLLWVCVLCVIFYLVFRYRHWLAELVPNKTQEKRAKTETLFGLNIAQESLPDDVGTAARFFWQEGKQREALALLYRACLSQLVGRGLELEDGDTELECLKATRDFAPALKLNNNALAYFSTLTSYWRKLAYGHIP